MRAFLAAAPAAVHAWYEDAELTPAAAKRLGFRSCCAHSDVVRTQFRVEKTTGADQWWWLDNGAWKQIPPDIIHWGEGYWPEPATHKSKTGHFPSYNPDSWTR